MENKLYKAKKLLDGEFILGYYVKLRDYLDNKKIIHAIVPTDAVLFPRGEIVDFFDIDPDTLQIVSWVTCASLNRECSYHRLMEDYYDKTYTDIDYCGYDPGRECWYNRKACEDFKED